MVSEDTMVAYIFASSSCGLGMNSSWGMQLYNAHGESTQSPEYEDCVDLPSATGESVLREEFMPKGDVGFFGSAG